MEYYNTLEQKHMENYPLMEKEIKTLVNAFDEYCISDITICVFVITSWLDNRSAIQLTLAMNAALHRINGNGNKRIQDYESFSCFFHQISGIISVDPKEDIQCPDFGQVKVCFDNEYYSVIIGTGYDFTYQALQFFSSLARELDVINDTKCIMEYYDIICTRLTDLNISQYSSPDIRFELPTESYFYAVLNLLGCDGFCKQAMIVYQILSLLDINLAAQYFIINEHEVFPVFDTCFLLDCYSSYLNKARNSQTRKHVDQALAIQAYRVFCAHNDEQNSALINAIVWQDEKPVMEFVFSFALLSSNTILLGLQTDENKMEELETFIKRIETLQANSELVLVEMSKNEHGHKALKVQPECKIEFLLYNDYTDVTLTTLRLKNKDSRTVYWPLEIMFLLCFTDSIDEICEFNNFLECNKSQLLSWSGVADVYVVWKKNNKLIEKGAINFGTIMIEASTTAGFIYDYFKNELDGYPFSATESIFIDPFAWKITIIEGVRETVSKSNIAIGGFTYSLSNNCFLFYQHNLNLWKNFGIDPQSYEFIRLLDELNQKLTTEYWGLLSSIKCTRKTVLQVFFIPIDYAEEKGYKYVSDRTRSLVFSDIHINGAMVQLRYSLDFLNLFDAIKQASDRKIECQYMCELFNPLFELEYKGDFSWQEVIMSKSNEKKTIGTFQYETEYCFPTTLVRYTHETADLLHVKKQIAIICKLHGIEPGEYTGKKAWELIRKMQEALVHDFESKMKNINQRDLHIGLLSRYATVVHNINISRQRYQEFDDLREDVLESFKINTEDQREELKRYREELLYCLDTNLALNRNVEVSGCESSDLGYIIAYANWIVTLLTSSDVCFHGMYDETIRIQYDYQVDNVQSDEEIQRILAFRRRRYSVKDYAIRCDEPDSVFIHRAKDAFKADTGINFDLAFNLLEILSTLPLYANIKTQKEISPGVYSVNIEELYQVFSNVVNTSMEEFEAIIHWFCVRCDELKVLDGEEHPILPTWEREKRENRFEVKPFWLEGLSLMWSPVMTYELGRRWIFGLQDFYLPYEIGLDNLVQVLNEWRTRYQKLMVYDLERILKDEGFDYVKTNAELHRIDKKGGHPSDLGDYDLIGVKHSTKQIIIIESKYIHKVGSIAEHVFQQKGFFQQGKYDQRFQRRIDYFRTAYQKLFSDLDIPVDATYSIMPYMITNKVFSSWYKEIQFPIVSYSEFEAIIKSSHNSMFMTVEI